MKRFIAICFDISSDSRRRKVVKALMNNGQRVQKSVFECLLNDQQWVRLKSKIETIIDPRTDSLRYYIICKNCKSNVVVYGQGSYTEDEKTIVV